MMHSPILFSRKSERDFRSLLQHILFVLLFNALLAEPLFSQPLFGQPLFGQPPFRYEQNQSLEWHEVIDAYQEMASSNPMATMYEIGMSDAGKPLHLFIISGSGNFDPAEIRENGKRILFINNGIHPGECNGIEGTLEFASDLLYGQDSYSKYLENTIVVIVPVFNIGGALNRSKYHRANQNGPVEHGYRGNARNLDLNRDFVKLETRNARILAIQLRKWDPDLFIDTHSTNGADYPATVTLITSHPQQLEEPQAKLMTELLEPWLYKEMNRTPYKMCHYVNVFRTSPHEGFPGMIDSPRYLTSFATFFHIPSFTLETHMLKPYSERVKSTTEFNRAVLKFTSTNAKELAETKKAAISSTLERDNYVIQWENDPSSPTMIEFNGFEAKMRRSDLTGQIWRYYDTTETWTREIPWFNTFLPTDSVSLPEYYIIPHAWEEVILRMELCGVKMYTLDRDTTLTVEAYRIEDFSTISRPYNGHFSHYNTSTSVHKEELNFFAGDRFIPARQRASKYLVQVLEPRAQDSYFSWNFFDPILSRNEYFSPYLFEPTATEFLDARPDLMAQFMDLRQRDTAFAKDHYRQLRWVYERSPWSEPTYRRYPVYRLNGRLPDSLWVEVETVKKE